MRFLHTADLHLGKPFGQFDEDTRAALRQARLDALRAIGEAAQSHAAPFVLIAGDTFDAETPHPKLLRRALTIMAEASGVTWVLMPGNHDSLAAVDLWDRIARDCPANVRLALTPEPLALTPEAVVLPAPPTVRDPGHDLTAWMESAETPGQIRIGLGHGGVVSFDTEEATLAVIPPDRAARAGLDYLALGDWHGQLCIEPRTWYAGTPEPDRFKPHAPAGVLLVEIASPGAAPDITPLPIARYTWRQIRWTCLSGNDAVAELNSHLADLPARETSLLALHPNGRLGLSELTALRTACAAMADDFHHFTVTWDSLGIEQVPGDLDLISEGGALRAAAESLLAATDLAGRTEQDARIAQIALTHLFHLATDGAEADAP